MIGQAGPTAAHAQQVTAEIVRHGLAGAADEMRLALVRTAFSPIVYEGQDLAAALYDPEIRLLAQCQTLPLFQGTLDVCVRATLDRLGGSEQLRPGDVALANYPWDTGSHANDIAIVVPGYLDGRHIGYAVVKAHHMDVGGVHAGVSTDSTDVWQEGRLYPVVRVLRAGKRDDDLHRTLLANTRLPEAFAGDLRAQIGAAHAGLDGLARVIQAHGQSTFDAAAKAMFRHGERCMREFIGALPDGRWTASGAHDSGSGGLHAPADYEVVVEVAGESIRVDLTRAAQQAAGPVNSPRAAVVSAVRAALMSLAGASEIASDGHFRPIQVDTKPGTIFDPLPPAPVGLYAFPLLPMVDVIYRALSSAVPDAIPAAGNDVVGFALFGERDDGGIWGAATHFCGGQGASAAYGDGGGPIMHIAASGVRLSSLEAWEAMLPVTIVDAELAPDSGGAGRFQGSAGPTIRMQTHAEMDLVSIFERTQSAPFGLLGGQSGRANRLRLRRPDRTVEDLGRSNRRIPAGTRIEIELSGGGGHGSPHERDPAAVRRDLDDGVLSEQHARDRYPHAFEAAP